MVGVVCIRSYEGKEAAAVSVSGGIAVPVVRSMASTSWPHDVPVSWATPSHSYRYAAAHQRSLLGHAGNCNPAGGL